MDNNLERERSTSLWVIRCYNGYLIWDTLSTQKGIAWREFLRGAGAESHERIPYWERAGYTAVRARLLSERLLKTMIPLDPEP